MLPNEIFNITICIVGIAILLVHIVDSLFKKNKRRDEFRLLNFLMFTAIHFICYLSFSLIKIHYTGDNFIIASYTIFYIFNNVEVLFFTLYMLSYVSFEDKEKKVISIINYSVFGVFIILDITNIFTHMFFTSIDGVYTRSDLMILSQGYQFILLALVFIVTLLNKKLVLREKVAFALYCLLPGIAIILQNAFKGYAIAYASIIIALEILFFFLNVKRNLLLEEEERKNQEAQIKIMVSQIQPHFVYNSLSSISTLIPLDPQKAQETLDAFTEYLRRNLSSLTETKLISFEDELKHIETYIALERVRFNDRINVIYDIQAKDFYLPPLTIQPIVENAVKHGILKKLEGGTLTLKTYETDEAYVVEVKDDGVGFNKDEINFKDNKHIGLMNIKQRLKSMVKGDMIIESAPSKGTKVTINFYK